MSGIQHWLSMESVQRVSDELSALQECELSGPNCVYFTYYYQKGLTFAMSQGVTYLLSATRSNEYTLLLTACAIFASPQPKSATTCSGL